MVSHYLTIVLTSKQAMVLFPEAQVKAQEEIDSVIGSGRLPEWNDRKDLPYVRGVVEETLRCELSATHRKMEETLMGR